ncbi:hypothetical protein HGRIS_001713 [Hohenbuehelia grisea]|uniref:F-box domain-containing protein n=1 Tax=Hohenbuehelia grisea TaxID=104357 RepID=A0ABR3JJ84_9AGAR
MPLHPGLQSSTALRIPVEVWDLAFSETCLTKVDLQNLTRTHSVLRSAARPILFRAVQLDVPSHQMEEDEDGVSLFSEAEIAKMLQSYTRRLTGLAESDRGRPYNRLGETSARLLVREIGFQGQVEYLDDDGSDDEVDVDEDVDNLEAGTGTPRQAKDMQASYGRLVQAFVDNLSRFPNIVTVRIADLGYVIHSFFRRQLFLLSQLRSLTITGCSIRVAINDKPLPRLEELTLLQCSADAGDAGNVIGSSGRALFRLFEPDVIRRIITSTASIEDGALLKDLQRPLPALRHLRILVAPDTVDLFRQTLTCSPALEVLELDHMMHNDSWMAGATLALRHFDLPRTALPCLRRLRGAPQALGIFIPGRPVEDVEVVSRDELGGEYIEDAAVLSQIFADIALSTRSILGFEIRAVSSRTQIFSLITRHCPNLLKLGLEIRPHQPRTRHRLEIYGCWELYPDGEGGSVEVETTHDSEPGEASETSVSQEPVCSEVERYMERYDLSLPNPAGPGHETRPVAQNPDGSAVSHPDALEGVVDAIQSGLFKLPESLESFEIKMPHFVHVTTSRWSFDFRDEICLVQYLAHHLHNLCFFRSERPWRKINRNSKDADWMGPPRPLLPGSGAYARVKRAMHADEEII